jgi:hypothetical protein
LPAPRGSFDDATFERIAKAFEDPDFVRISPHHYRWYMRVEHGESKYDELEARIATFPTISLPTIKKAMRTAHRTLTRAPMPRSKSASMSIATSPAA